MKEERTSLAEAPTLPQEAKEIESYYAVGRGHNFDEATTFCCTRSLIYRFVPWLQFCARLTCLFLVVIVETSLRLAADAFKRELSLSALFSCSH